jgi:uncharacterized ferritin-like protein (DUF455 family)
VDWHNLHAAALDCLLEVDVAAKLRKTAAAAAAWQRGELSVDAHGAPPIRALPEPGRPARPLLVSPRDVARRSLGSAEGRAALLHAVAHIEFNAVNLAWDAVYRFRDLPRGWADDWVGVAADEARHFALLAARLAEHGMAYGDLPAHDGLWQMAVQTAHDPLARMALVPRVLEARGLDVTPPMIERLRSVGDFDTVAVLEVILREEIAHVAAGTRWFEHLCAERGLDPQATFVALIREFAPTAVRGPFNRVARAAAGFGAAELAALDALQ